MAFPVQGSAGSLAGSAKLEAVTKLLKKLTSDLDDPKLSSQDRDAALEELKIYGRDPRNSDPIFTKEGITTLTRYAFDTQSPTTSRNALRVIANAMLLKPETRQIFVDLGYESKLCSVLKRDSLDDEFLASRILFLTTYGTTIKLQPIIEQYHLADIITERLAKHASLTEDESVTAGKSKVDPMEDMALSEILRLLFNVTHFCSEQVAAFTQTIPHILTILHKRELPSTNPLDPPFGSLVNTLVNLNLSDKEVQPAFYPEDEPTAVATKLIELLDLSTKQYKENELEQTVSPLVGVIRAVHENAPETVRQYIRGRLLPTEEDRESVLGRSQTLASRLLRNSTSPVTPELGKLTSLLLFEMSDKDASKFVENVGYGFASGFLFQNNIPIPENASGGGADDAKKAFNPITGQFLDKENVPDLPEMTDEEKEREAERLFVLFERLKKTGIVDVENPVTKAYQEGRIQELDDDENVVEELD